MTETYSNERTEVWMSSGERKGDDMDEKVSLPSDFEAVMSDLLRTRSSDH